MNVLGIEKSLKYEELSLFMIDWPLVILQKQKANNNFKKMSIKSRVFGRACLDTFFDTRYIEVKVEHSLCLALKK